MIPCFQIINLTRLNLHCLTWSLSQPQQLAMIAKALMNIRTPPEVGQNLQDMISLLKIM
jgi:hypothetical protein